MEASAQIKKNKGSIKTRTLRQLLEDAEKARNEFLKNNAWQITKSGDLVHTSKNYTISKSQLVDDNILLQIEGKRWTNLNEFFPVFREACKRAGIESFQRVSY